MVDRQVCAVLSPTIVLCAIAKLFRPLVGFLSPDVGRRPVGGQDDHNGRDSEVPCRGCASRPLEVANIRLGLKDSRGLDGPVMGT